MSYKKDWTEVEIERLTSLRLEGLTWAEISETMGDVTPNQARKAFYRYIKDGVTSKASESPAPKVLILDIETAPMEGYFWGLFNQNIGLEMVKQHTTILSWSAKWMHAPETQVMYMDQRNAKSLRDDTQIIKVIHSLLDEADVVVTQNGISFDIPKLNYRFVEAGLKPPSSFKHIDTLRIAKKVFGFDSNKLAHMTDKLCVKYKKLQHGKFPGFALWKECMNGNIEAWKEMEEYNKHDVLALEELYVDHFAKWDQSINFAPFTGELKFRCNCGSDSFHEKGFYYTKKSKFKRFICDNCGKEHRESKNLFTKEQRAELKV